MVDYGHAITALFPEGVAIAKILDVKICHRRDPEEWGTLVDTLVIKLACIHADGTKAIYFDSIPITRTFVCRIDELRRSLGETLPPDSDPARANWNEETARGQTVFIRFTVWKSKEKTGNNIRYLLPADGAEIFREATQREEVSA
jgi:hypothetical protein